MTQMHIGTSNVLDILITRKSKKTGAEIYMTHKINNSTPEFVTSYLVSSYAKMSCIMWLLSPAAVSFHCKRSLETSFHMSLMQSTRQPMCLLHSNSYNGTTKMTFSNTNHRSMH